MITSDQKLAAMVDQTFREFVWMPNEHSYTVASTFVLGTHLRSITGDFLPHAFGRLYFGSKIPGCGKTLAGTLAMAMSYNGKSVLNPTAPSIITYLHLEKATVAFDEFDRYMGSGRGNNAMRTVIDGGYKSEQYITKQRQDEVVEELISGPMILMGKNYSRFVNSETFDTTRSRSHVILLERAPEELVDDYAEYEPEIHDERFRRLSRQLATWGRANARTILSSKPDIPRGISNRDKEIWKPMFQIAEFIGGNWPQRVTDAARAFVLGEHEDEMVDSPADELLKWTKSIFRGNEAQLSSAEIVSRLLALPGEHWWKREWRNERAATMSLARQLAVNGVEKSKLYIDGDTPNGYRRSDLGMATVDLEEDWEYKIN